MTSEQLIEHRAKSIDICGVGELCCFTGSLFWRHVAWCAHHFQRARDGALGLEQPGEAKIGQMRFSFFVQQDISWLDVSMQDAVFMRVMNGASYLCNELRRLSCRHRFTADYFI